MIAQIPIQTDYDRPLTTPVERDTTKSTGVKPMGVSSTANTSKTQKPRFESVHHSWEYFQNELEFE